MTSASQRPPVAFWLLLPVAFGLVALETVMAVRQGLAPDPCGARAGLLSDLELRARQTELVVSGAATEGALEGALEPLDTLGAEARALALDLSTLQGCEAGPALREAAVAIALIYAEPLPPPEVGPRQVVDLDALRALLPPDDARGALGRVVAAALDGEAPSRADLDRIATAPASDWLRRRVASFLRSPADAFDATGSFGATERLWGGQLALVVGTTGLFGLAGLGALIAWPLLRRRLGPPKLRPEALLPQPPWVALYGVALWIALSYVTSLVIHSIDGVPLVLGQLAVQLTAGLTTVGVLRRLRARPLAPGLGPFGGVLRPVIGWSLLGWSVAIPVALVFGHLSTWLVPLQDPVIPSVVETFSSAHPTWAALLVVSIVGLAPFFEELVFRSLLFRDLRTRFGFGAAAALSALVFALMHANPATALPLFGLGLVLAWTVERSGGVLPAMGVHMLWNGGQVLLMLLVRS